MGQQFSGDAGAKGLIPGARVCQSLPSAKPPLLMALVVPCTVWISQEGHIGRYIFSYNFLHFLIMSL